VTASGSSATRAVIFDFGGVFIDSPFASLADAAERRGLVPEEVALAVFGDYERDTDHPWHRLERGEITIVETRDEILARHPLPDGTAVDFFELLEGLGGGGVRDDMVEFCLGLRQRGLLTGLLTNNAKEFEAAWKAMLPLDDLFDDVVDSSEVGLRKPDPAIYRLSLERLDVQPGEAVFIDDAPGNVAGAVAVGIPSVLIGHDRADVAAAVAEVEALLGAGPIER
jgi:epoxide hydrolase-like predicted phosphatase